MKTMKRIKRRMEWARSARSKNNDVKERYNQFIKNRLQFDSYMHIDGSISYHPYYVLKYDFKIGNGNPSKGKLSIPNEQDK